MGICDKSKYPVNFKVIMTIHHGPRLAYSCWFNR